MGHQGVLPRNAIGPLLVLKHFSPLLKSGASEASVARAVFYSARVGSIGDNATGTLTEQLEASKCARWLVLLP